MLTDVLKEKLTEARKAGNKTQMSLLQVILGEVSTQQARSGKGLTDEQVEGVIRGLVTKNDESLALIAGKGMAQEPQLREENVFLNSLLPTVLTVDEIKTALADLTEQIKSAKNDGMATGLAMKFLKPKGLKVLGDDVKKAVEQLRQAS
jgi:uncharacterized protein YqeY